MEKNKKEYFDAKHNCYAYRCIEPSGTIIERSSDDGEPSKTAGAPMLDILRKKDIVNTLVIVTRYFGGILLGTGGLVRAYSDSCIMVLEQSNISMAKIVNEYFVEINYSDITKLKYICEKENISIEKEDYRENINIKLYTNNEKIETIKSQIKDIRVKEGSKNILI